MVSVELEPRARLPSATPGDAIVITGLGLVTPLGASRETTWRQLLAGQQGLRWLEGGAAERCAPLPVKQRWGGSVPGFPREHRDHLLTDLALAAAQEAIDDAGLSNSLPPETGCVFGASKGNLAAALTCLPGRCGDDTGAAFAALMPAAPAQAILHRWKLQGPSLVPVAACATGLVAVMRGVELLRQRTCDIVLAGSADASLTGSVLASFRRLGVLANPGNDPGSACRPFDQARTGFGIGEGAACFVLERAESARQRRATWYARWNGGLMATDPTGMTVLNASGELLSQTIQRLVKPETIGAVHVHGTGTQLNDLVEGRALRSLWGERIAELPIAAIKGATGHLLGAAGSVELGLAALSLRDQLVPPAVTLQTPDPACWLPGLSHQPRAYPHERILKISLGFGGHLAIACLERTTDCAQRAICHHQSP